MMNEKDKNKIQAILDKITTEFKDNFRNNQKFYNFKNGKAVVADFYFIGHEKDTQ